MWKTQVFENTRSRAPIDHQHDRTVWTPWMLEPVWSDDLIIYQLARSDVDACSRSMREQAMSLGVFQRVRSLLMAADGTLTVDDIRRGTTYQDAETGICVDITAVVRDGTAVMLTPWRKISRPRLAILRWVQDRLGPSWSCRWLSMDAVQRGAGDDWIMVDPTIVPPPEFPTRRYRIARLMMEGSSLVDSCHEMRPNLKSVYRHLPSEVAAEKYRRGVDHREISLLPYVSDEIRKRCHAQHVYEYTDPLFLKILHQGSSANLNRFTIPWVDFVQSSHDIIRVRYPERLDVFVGTTAGTETMMFVDFETLGPAQTIYLCGIWVVQSAEQGARFHSFWSADVNDPVCERRLLEQILRFITSFSEYRLFFYAAERRFWKSACGRHGWSLDDPRARLFDRAIDLLVVLQSAGILLRDAPNHKLKTIGAALVQHRFTSLSFPKTTIKNGEDSMQIARLFYQSLDRDPHETHLIDEPDDLYTNPYRHALWVYNRYDCQILHTLFGWLHDLNI